MVKGVLRADDARLRDRARARPAMVVSNHGGRNLDTVPATIDALPRDRRRGRGPPPVLFDGGVRRGVDVVKALALGATAVMVGRPYLVGLAAAGADGVHARDACSSPELEMAMAQCGAASLEVTPDLVTTRRADAARATAMLARSR